MMVARSDVGVASGVQALGGVVRRGLRGRRLGFETAHRLREIASPRVRPCRCAAGRIGSSAQQQPAPVGEVALGGHRGPAGRQLAPATHQLVDPRRHHRPAEGQRRVGQADPLVERVRRANRGKRAVTAVACGRTDGQQPRGAARVGHGAAGVRVVPQQCRVDLAADHRLDGGP